VLEEYVQKMSEKGCCGEYLGFQGRSNRSMEKTAKFRAS